MKKLGFGMMRLPTADPKNASTIQLDQVCRMVDTFLDRGFVYFDTAYFYHEGESEHIVRKALTERHSRQEFLLADKLPVMFLKEKTQEDQARIFDHQLEKCGVEYFDYYLLHCLTAEAYETAAALDTFAFLSKKKAEGKLRHLGFSFHDKADVLDRILTDHPETEFVQLQLNYLDWEDGTVQSKLCYETAVRHGKKVVVMEPVKGGRLARLPEEAERLLLKAHPDWSNASWAIRFAASLENVMMVLSGMSDMEQMLDNTGYMSDFAPLTGEETALLEQCAGIIARTPAIPCTACRYCVETCPQAIPIPDYFALYNQVQVDRRRGLEPSREAFDRLGESGGRPQNCLACGQCDSACPQHIQVKEWVGRMQYLF